MKTQPEREITNPVNLCRENGDLNPDATGFSRHPLHMCNLSGRWPRKKRWNYWNMTTDRFAFCAAVSSVDYVALIFSYFLDYETLDHYEFVLPVPFGACVKMGDLVGDDASYRSRLINVAIEHGQNNLRITADTPHFSGKKMNAEILVHTPPDHETLNVVVPWSEKQFQFTSKQNTFAAEGEINIGDKKYSMQKETGFACQDFGRGIWPYRTKWNWSAFSHRQAGDTIGLNLGGIWTDGTGATENGICLNGKLFKISDPAKWTYDDKNFMAPWKLETPESGAVDLTFTPFYDKITGINLGLVRTGCHQCFGRFNGILRAGDREVEVKDAIGWAEESISKW